MNSPPDLLVFADDWGRHPSSCQHLIRRIRKDWRVLWVNSIGTRQVKADSFTYRRGLEKLRSWSRGLCQVNERMWVLDVPMLPAMGSDFLKRVNRTLVTVRLRHVLTRLGMARPVVLTTLPYISRLIHGLSRRAVVYYCTDDYSQWPGADHDVLQAADRELSAQADIILAASRALYDSHKSDGNVHYFPHGVDFEHFASTRQQTPPLELLALPGPRVGFFGLIYEKLDFELLTAVARHIPHGSLVMIGPQAYCPSEFAAVPNVRFLGQKAYADLPRYLAGLDVLLLPYVDDLMIRQSGPLKLRECLASGKPTVSIDIHDVRRLVPHVRIAATPNAYLQAVEDALREPVDSPAVTARQHAVEQDGWDRRADQLKAAITGLLTSSTAPRHVERCQASTNGHATLVHPTSAGSH